MIRQGTSYCIWYWVIMPLTGISVWWPYVQLCLSESWDRGRSEPFLKPWCNLRLSTQKYKCKKIAFTHKKFPYHFKRLVPPTPSSCTDSLIEMFCDRAYVWKKNDVHSASEQHGFCEGFHATNDAQANVTRYVILCTMGT